MNRHLLVTKIIVPARRADVLRRPRLLDFLHESLDRKLILISASAGYGKTSLLVDLAHDTELPVCWYSLDAGDGDPQVFLEYLVASLQRRFPHFGGRTLSLLRDAERARDLDGCLAALVSDIQQEIDSLFVLVLDDYHLVEGSAAVNRLIDRLLYYLPENAHLILSSRTIPTQITLTRLTARQQVAGLGTSDLRFTADEIRALMQLNYGLEITPKAAQELADQSEGWIVGIILTAPTIWRGLFKEWVKGYGPSSQLFDYLAAEVFSQQPEPLQHFLLETSILEQMNPSLCDELLGRKDAQAQLQLAERRNLFVTRLEDQGYRYHHLFREFLQAQLRQTNPARMAELQRRAAQIFESRGQLGQAVRYWLAANEPEAAARLLETIANEYYDLGRWTTLVGWLDALPPQVLDDKPDLVLVRARLAGEMGEPDKARAAFEQARAAFERRKQPSDVARVIFEAAKYSERSDDAFEECRRAAEQLPPQDYALNALAQKTLGTMLVRKGDWKNAVPYLERALELYSMAGDRYHYAFVGHDLGAVYMFIGEKNKAHAHFEQALSHWRKLGHAGTIANTLNSMGVAQYQAGALKQAQELLQEALRYAREARNLRIEAYTLASLGDVYRDQGKLPEALKAYTDASDLAERVRENFLITFTRVAAGDVWRLSGDLPTAERILQTALQAASAHQSEYESGLAHLGMGILRLDQDDIESARQHLERALALLEAAHAKRDLGRARLYLAEVALRRKRTAEAQQHLRALAALGKELSEDQFLLMDAARTRAPLEFALARRIGSAYFRQILKKLEQAPRGESISTGVIEEGWPALDIYTFGEARVMRDGSLVPNSIWQTSTTKELFFFFVTHPQSWRKEQVLEHIWPNASRGQANDLFHSSVYRIRRALFPECLLFSNGMYQLNLEAVRWVDVTEFEAQLAAAAQAQQVADKISALERAVELYRGDYLDEFYSDWCASRREQLRARYLDALSQLAQCHVELGNPKRALELYQLVLSKDRVNEAAYRELMRLYMRLGNRPAAIQVYQQCVETLKEELGVPPMPETTALYEQLLRIVQS